MEAGSGEAAKGGRSFDGRSIMPEEARKLKESAKKASDEQAKEHAKALRARVFRDPGSAAMPRTSCDISSRRAQD